MVKYGSERIIVELLDVLDIFDRALQSQVSVDSLDSFRQGFEMTAQEFRKVLSRFGVQDLDSKGKPFDPSLHEALSSEETNEVEPGHVTQVFKEAYKLHDKIIRPGQVVVAKPKTESGSESKERVEE
jgi:molecular chaperone GrpE